MDVSGSLWPIIQSPLLQLDDSDMALLMGVFLTLIIFGLLMWLMVRNLYSG